MSAPLDIDSARTARPYSRAEYLKRVLWAACRPLFRFSPRPVFRWRVFLLRRFGARIGERVHIYPRAEVVLPWMLEVGDDAAIADDVLIYDLGLVRIGARATISHRAQICAGTHDYRDRTLPLRRVPVTIGADAWICTAALIGPEVVVGEGAVVGAGAVVLKDVEPWTVVVGNPAQTVKRRELRAP